MNKNSCKLAILIAGMLSLPGFAADHREAPRVQEDPTADINDIYVFRNPNDSTKLVLVMTVNPFSVIPQALSYRFSPNVRYRFNIDNNGNAFADRVIDVTFSPSATTAQQFTATFPGNIRLTGDTTPPTVAATPNPPNITRQDGIRVFAGQRDDPFFFDLVGFNRFLSNTGTFTGTDAFAGVNISAIVVEIPLDMVTDGGRTQLQIWGETDRTQVTTRSDSLTARLERHSGRFVQFERMGNPVVNTVFIPSDLKDRFNVVKPHRDASVFGDIILARLDALGTNQSNIDIITSVAIPDTLKLDLNSPDGFPNGRRLQDDVIDTLLTLIFNGNEPTGDGVGANDREFLTDFPYLAEPFQPPASP